MGGQIMKDPNKKTQITFSMENHFIEKLDKYADKDGRTRSNTIRAIVVKELERMEKESKK